MEWIELYGTRSSMCQDSEEWFDSMIDKSITSVES